MRTGAVRPRGIPGPSHNRHAHGMERVEWHAATLLVGSLPYETAEEAFRGAGTALNGHVGWLPDGEPGIRGEIRKALETIPPEDLVIQWDVALEFWTSSWAKKTGSASGRSERWKRSSKSHSEQLDELWQGIPDETLLGIHWCFGTMGGWPMADLPDLDLCVRMSNEAKRRFGRRLDYVHLPVTTDPDDAFFAPLDRLDIGDTKVFLGMVHHTDGIDAFRQRRDRARKHLDKFGIGSVCASVAGIGKVETAGIEPPSAVA